MESRAWIRAIFAGIVPFIVSTGWCEDKLLIQATKYPVEIVRPSKSEKIYLLQLFPDDQKDGNKKPPQPGRVILLKKDTTPVMAFRVLKSYKSTKQIAAKKVRTYPAYARLEPREKFDAYEKKGEILVQTKPPPPEEVKDLKEIEVAEGLSLEEPIADPMDEVPLSEPPLPAEPAKESLSLEEPITDPMDEPVPPVTGKQEGLSLQEPIEESPPPEAVPTTEATPEIPVDSAPPAEPAKPLSFDPIENVELDPEDFKDESEKRNFTPWSAELFGGLARGVPVAGSGFFQNAVGVFIGRDIFSRFLFFKDVNLNRLTAEAGFYYYQLRVDDNGTQKLFTMMPYEIRGRYSQPLSENWSLQAYGGLYYSFAASYTNVTEEDTKNAQRVIPVFGGAMEYRFGPQWYIRFILGLSQAGLSVVLRF